MPQAQQGMNISDSAQINVGVVNSGDIANGAIVDEDINAGAAIAGSKLQALSVGVNAGVIPSTGIADAHVAAGAAISGSKLQALSVGVNAGVIPSTGIADAHVAAGAAIAQSKIALSVANADVAADAAIVDTKLAQIVTASKVSGAAITLLTSLPAAAGVIPAANLPAPPTIAFPGTNLQPTGQYDTWLDLDLSSVVGANRALVYIAMTTVSGGVRQWRARENGNTVNYGYEGSDVGNTQAAAVKQWVLTDASGIIEVKNDYAGSIQCNFWVEAYIKA